MQRPIHILPHNNCTQLSSQRFAALILTVYVQDPPRQDLTFNILQGEAEVPLPLQPDLSATAHHRCTQATDPHLSLRHHIQ